MNIKTNMKKQNSINGSIIIFLVFILMTIFHQFYYADTTLNPTEPTPVPTTTPPAATFEPTPPPAAAPTFEPTPANPDLTAPNMPAVAPTPTAPSVQPPMPAASAPMPAPVVAATSQMNEFAVINLIAVAFDKLKGQGVYSIKNLQVAEYLRSHVTDYIYNKNFTIAKKQIKATIKQINSKDTESLDTIDITLLDKSKLLITVPYSPGKLQTSNLFFTYDGKDLKFTALPFEPEDGADYEEYNFSSTAPAIVTESAIIHVISKSRAEGDCGIISTYKFINDFFKIINQREVTCAK